jgi:hypothetical protein
MTAPIHPADTMELADIYAALNADERKVLLTIAQRLMVGRRQYGALDLATDRRNWAAEAQAEALDMAVYLTIEMMMSR